MGKAEFVHLHLHTEFSLLDAACKVDRLMEHAKALEFPAMAMTDHGVMYGAIEFYQAARKAGIKPIIGCEVYVAPGSRLEKKSSIGGKEVYNHLVLLAKDQTGYKNLVRLVSDAHLEGYYYKPRIDKEILEAHKEGLIALSGCLASEIPALIHHDKLPQARDAVDWFRQVFGEENFYLELQNHGIPEQQLVNRHLIEWASEFNLNLVATNDVHYIKKEHSHAHDSLICIGTQSHLNDTKRMSYVPEQFYLRSAQEMATLFKEVPQAVSNTLAVAEKCDLEINFGELHYPVFDPPETYTREGYLRYLLGRGLYKRYRLDVEVDGEQYRVQRVEDPSLLPGLEAWTQDAPDQPLDPSHAMEDTRIAEAVKILLDRLEVEMGVIEQMGFVSYFLIVGDFVQYGREKGISCVARGSAAGSLVTYLLEISNVDPIRYGLLFERFLNPERVNPPDIDIDFADDRRADVIEYTREKYGRECVAQIGTFGTMGAKSVIRDVGRVMGLSYGEVDRLAKMVPNDLKITLAKSLEKSPDLKNAYESEEVTRELIDTAFILEDVTRNCSVHAAGVVIGAEPLYNVLPLKQDENGGTVTQYAMNPVGDLGLLKMDFLGLKTLSVIRNCCEMIQLTKGVTMDMDRLPLDDGPTYELLNKGNTVGVFQLESGGMRDLCRKFQIASVEHITALVSLYRPGPMDLIPDFIRRRHGEVEIEHPHPLLKPICEETYGIMIYQEQVMQAAQILAGYTLGGADLLRRAMGKKKVEVMQEHRKLFVDGCAKLNQIPAAKANEVFDLLEKFAGYGFNKSHAAAYAVVAYQTAYLKANHTVEFLAAMMTNDMSDTAKLSILIEEARQLNVDVLPPDINESRVVFAPAQEGKVIRFGLAAIKGVGEAAVAQLLEARDKDGKFSSLYDLCLKVDGRTLNRKMLEALIKSGACDGLGENRATLFGLVDKALSRASSIASDRSKGQTSLFGEMDSAEHVEITDNDRVEDWPQAERLAAEKELLGFYVSGHPLNPFESILRHYGLGSTVSIASLPDRSMTRVGGMIAAMTQGFSKKSGKPYAMLTLEDLEGQLQILCMNEQYDKHRHLFEANRAIMVVGEVNNSEDRPKIFPQEIFDLEQAPGKYTQQIHLRVPMDKLTGEQLDAVMALVQQHPGGCPLFFCFIKPDGQIAFMECHEKYAMSPSLALQREIEALFGRDSYYVKVDRTLPERQRARWERSRQPSATTD